MRDGSPVAVSPHDDVTLEDQGAKVVLRFILRPTAQDQGPMRKPHKW